MSRRRRVGLGAAVASAAVLLGGAGIAAEFDLELHAAQQELKLARRLLQNAPKRYEGRREKAMDHVKAAQRQIRLGLLDAASEREHPPAQQHAPLRRPR
jgi:hypothetical protein